MKPVNVACGVTLIGKQVDVMLKTVEINIRDPFVLNYAGLYYLYGTRSATCWGPADGFDCYVSEDLENWEGPVEIFKRPEGFFADEAYWAPECLYHDGFFYLITTLGAGDRKKGVYALRSEKPSGPYEVYSERLTPEDWVCIDGTVYFEGGTPYLIFSHSFEDCPDGDMCMIRLTDDLSASAGEAVKLFSAGEAKWANPIPFAKAEFGIDGDVYFTDGPGLLKGDDGKLYMTWSSWGTRGYAVGTAVSEGGLNGPWMQLDTPIFPVNGGHGMVFKNIDDEYMFALHFPNDKFKEHPVFIPMKIEDGEIKLEISEELKREIF